MAFVLCAEKLLEDIQTLGPEAFVEPEPLVRARKRSRVEAAHMGAPTHLAADQPRILQRLDVLRGGRERHREGVRKLAYGSLANSQFAKHLPARGVAKGVKDGVQLRSRLLNHMVEYKDVFLKINQMVE